MSDELNLLPCPFCGWHGSEFQERGRGTVDWKFRIKCGDCPGQMLFYDSTKAEAIAAWNRRAAPCTTSGETVGQEVKGPDGTYMPLEKAWKAERDKRLKVEAFLFEIAARPGWKFVPVKIDDAMHLAAAEKLRVDTTPINKLFMARNAVEAAIAAAPTPPVVDEHAEFAKFADNYYGSYVDRTLDNARRKYMWKGWQAALKGST